MLIDTFLSSLEFPSKWLLIIFSTIFTDSFKIHCSFYHVSAFLNLDRTQSYVYKQTSKVLQEEINHFKMNLSRLPEYVPRLNWYFVLSLVTANMSYSA